MNYHISTVNNYFELVNMIFHENPSPPQVPPSDAAPGAASGFLADYLPFLLALASAAASDGFHAFVRSRGLRVPEWRVLACLHDCDGTMITRLAAQALMEQSAMTRVIERMEERGLVARRSDPRDRRRARVHLTPEGRVLAGDLVARAQADDAELMAMLPPEQRDTLKPLLCAFLAAQNRNILNAGPAGQDGDDLA
jgi:DNA-binding MarR family transcriptional regulator